MHGEGGSGKTALVTEVGQKAEELDMLNMRLGEESEEGRAQRLWLCLQEKKRILIIVDDIGRGFHLMDIGIRLDSVNN